MARPLPSLGIEKASNFFGSTVAQNIAPRTCIRSEAGLSMHEHLHRLDRSDLSCAARGIRVSRGHAINSIGVVTLAEYKSISMSLFELCTGNNFVTDGRRQTGSIDK